jgi:H/ACA ribonucleoprotein complex subunit 4
MLPQERVKRTRLIRSRILTSSKFGTIPEERDPKLLLNSGVVVLDKPPGPTSHQVSAWARDILGVEKAGHGGTLDPRVTGLLPVAFGTAANALQTLLLGGKEYVGIMQVHGSIPRSSIMDIFGEFTGKIYQMPPVRSAVKRRQRIREIYYLELLEVENRLALFRVGCEAGTYIRTLCHDIGDALGTGAHLLELRRTKIAGFTEDDIVTLQDLKDAMVFWNESKDEAYVREVILPLERLLSHLPQVVIKDSAVEAICHGANLAVPGIAEVDSGIAPKDAVALLTAKNEGIALGSALLTSEQMVELESGMAVNTQRVLMEPGLYPKMWHSN